MTNGQAPQDAETPAYGPSALNAGLGRTDAGAHTFKVPKMLMTPVTNWIEAYGMRRAIKVIDLQAANLRRLGNNRAAHDLREVAKALKSAITKENAVAERITLGWPNAEVSGAGTASG